MSDVYFIILLSILGAIAQFDWLKKWKYYQALEIIHLAVAYVYNEFVRDMKADGQKLTEEQRKQARVEAVKAAQRISKDRGLDLNHVLGEKLLEMYVEIAVSKAKR